jgi:hypothetical protein
MSIIKSPQFLGNNSTISGSIFQTLRPLDEKFKKRFKIFRSIRYGHRPVAARAGALPYGMGEAALSPSPAQLFAHLPQKTRKISVIFSCFAEIL